jgi:hypothetical protein
MRILPETSGRELPATIQEMELYITTPYKVPRKSKKMVTDDETSYPGIV